MLQQPPKTTNNTQGQGKSPTAPQSRSTKRKASAQTTTVILWLKNEKIFFIATGTSECCE